MREPDLRADRRRADLHGEVWVRFPGCSELAAAAGRDRLGSWKPTHGDGHECLRESEEVLSGGDREMTPDDWELAGIACCAEHRTSKLKQPNNRMTAETFAVPRFFDLRYSYPHH